MRPIKFRAWHKKCKTMWNVNSLIFYPGEEVCGVFTRGQTELGNFIVGTDFELMQYTGLTDKHGKEVCEGDIVRFTLPPEYGLPAVSTIVPIVWDEEQAGFCLGHMSNYLTIYDDLEVISNIYENPELLAVQGR